MAKNHDADYEAMSRAVESGNYRIRGPLESGATLRMGRPPKGLETGTAIPVSYRIPEFILNEVKRRVDAEQAGNDSELVRVALIEYFENHPA